MITATLHYGATIQSEQNDKDDENEDGDDNGNIALWRNHQILTK